MTTTGPTTFSFDAMKAIQQFKKGTTPLDVVEYLNVGRGIWHEGTLWYLNTFVSGDRSAVRFVKGAYGAGKTHLLYLTAKAALDRNFVVSYVTAEQANFAKFETVYRDMIRSLRTRKMVQAEGLDFAAQTNGLKLIIEDWYRNVRLEGEASVADRHREAAKVSARVRESIDDIDREKHWDANFRHAVQGYLSNLLAATAEGEAENDSILRWLQGDPLPRVETRSFGVYEPIKSTNSRDMFRSLTYMLKEFGYSGLVVLMDELERVLEQPPKSRDKAYQTVRQLLDNSDRAGTSSSYILCAVTPEVLTSAKGFKEYDALWERVKTEVNSSPKLIDKRAIIIDLELTPFDRGDLAKLAHKIRTIHSEALGWDASLRVGDDVIDAYIDQLFSYELEISKPRVLVRTITQILEKAEQHPHYDPLADVTGEITESVEVLKDQRSNAQWEF